MNVGDCDGYGSDRSQAVTDQVVHKKCVAGCEVNVVYLHDHLFSCKRKLFFFFLFSSQSVGKLPHCLNVQISIKYNKTVYSFQLNSKYQNAVCNFSILWDKISDEMLIYKKLQCLKKKVLILKYHRTNAHIPMKKFLCTLRKIEEYDKNETCWHNKSFVEP